MLATVSLYALVILPPTVLKYAAGISGTLWMGKVVWDRVVLDTIEGKYGERS